MGYTEKVVVIGAGISGLACAFRLKQLGLQPLVLESSERPGGVIQTVRRNGYLFDAGPQFPRFPEQVWKLVHELNLNSEFLHGDAKAKRYILKNGRLFKAPFSPGALLATPLVDLPAKIHFLRDIFRNSTAPAEEENLAEFVERKVGKEFLDYLVDPFVSTIFLGDVHKMGMESAFPDLVEWERTYGSLMRGALKTWKTKRDAKRSGNGTRHAESAGSLGDPHLSDALPSLGSFRSGMGTLPEGLAARLKENIHYGKKVESVLRTDDGGDRTRHGWDIWLSGGEQIAAETLVLAIPAFAAACLLKKTAPELASLLDEIEYAPFCAVGGVYNRSSVAHDLDGFGFMVPSREGLETFVTFWNSSLFPGRVSDGKVLITSFAGREAGSTLFSAPEGECARMVEAENAKILGISEPPLDRMVWRNPRALPQYNVGHARRVKQIGEAMRAFPNLQIAGNFLTGRSIGECVEIAEQVAGKVHGQLQVNDVRV